MCGGAEDKSCVGVEEGKTDKTGHGPKTAQAVAASPLRTWSDRGQVNLGLSSPRRQAAKGSGERPTCQGLCYFFVAKGDSSWLFFKVETPVSFWIWKCGSRADGVQTAKLGHWPGRGVRVERRSGVRSYSAERAERPPAALTRGVVWPAQTRATWAGPGVEVGERRNLYLPKKEALSSAGSARAADKPSCGPAAVSGSKHA